MKEIKVIDAHLHTYKNPEIALQAMGGVSRAGCMGTPEELLDIMDEAGIDMAIQLNMTPAVAMFQAAMMKLPPQDREQARPDIIDTMTGRIIRRNQWTCDIETENPRLVAFPSIDPIMGQESMVKEIEDRVSRNQIKGLKIHPAEGGFFPDEKILWPMYEAAQRLGLPVISHGGAFAADQEYTKPERFSRVLGHFKDLTLVVAHLGLLYWDESVRLAENYRNVYFDTSAAIHGDDVEKSLTDAGAVELIRKIGVDRVMFGSDFPWYHPGRSLKRLMGMPFSDPEKKAILSENAIRILKI
jgi:uncharacterized protein